MVKFGARPICGGVVLQDSEAQRVERADHRPRLIEPAEIAQRMGQCCRDAGLHLAGGFVGERDGCDRVAWNPLVHQVGDAAGNHPGFAASGAGDNQQRAIDMGGRFALWLGQSGDYLVYFQKRLHPRARGNRRTITTIVAESSRRVKGRAGSMPRARSGTHGGRRRCSVRGLRSREGE